MTDELASVLCARASWEFLFYLKFSICKKCDRATHGARVTRHW